MDDYNSTAVKSKAKKPFQLGITIGLPCNSCAIMLCGTVDKGGLSFDWRTWMWAHS